MNLSAAATALSGLGRCVVKMQINKKRERKDQISPEAL